MIADVVQPEIVVVGILIGSPHGGGEAAEKKKTEQG
jgi:hypothetical protein